MAIDKSVKSSSNSNPSIRIENKAGGENKQSPVQEAPLMIASGNVYLRLGFFFLLSLFGFLVWSHVQMMDVLQQQTKAIVSVAYTVGQHEKVLQIAVKPPCD